MNNNKFCTEDEAILISGVSSRTLLRFSEAGYLTLHSAPDGSRRYERTQVEEIFGMSSTIAPTVGSYESNNPSVTSVSNRAEEPSNSTMNGEPTQPSQTEQVFHVDMERAEHARHSVDSDSPPASRSSQDIEEISRLRNLLSLQERILDSKDDEIADLRNQRAWLRERIEKLEEKSDRDQILLLSETQTIRSLLAYQESRKSTFRQLLEWTGLYRAPSSGALPPAADYHSKSGGGTSSSRTIEVSKTANSD